MAFTSLPVGHASNKKTTSTEKAFTPFFPSLSVIMTSIYICRYVLIGQDQRMASGFSPLSHLPALWMLATIMLVTQPIHCASSPYLMTMSICLQQRRSGKQTEANHPVQQYDLRSRVWYVRKHYGLEQVVDKVKASPFFAIQLDESIDDSNISQLMVFVRFLEDDTITDDLYCRPPTTTTKADNDKETISTFFEREGLEWDKLVCVCTDGAPAMLGSKSGFGLLRW